MSEPNKFRQFLLEAAKIRWCFFRSYALSEKEPFIRSEAINISPHSCLQADNRTTCKLHRRCHSCILQMITLNFSKDKSHVHTNISAHLIAVLHLVFGVNFPINLRFVRLARPFIKPCCPHGLMCSGKRRIQSAGPCVNPYHYVADVDKIVKLFLSDKELLDDYAFFFKSDQSSITLESLRCIQFPLELMCLYESAKPHFRSMRQPNLKTQESIAADALIVLSKGN